MIAAAVDRTLDELLDTAHVVELRHGDRVVVLSDLHMGDGSARDDLRQNGALVETVLAQHYLRRGFSLVLNGDIEELQRFRLAAVRQRWAPLYRLFDAFAGATALYTIVGNHDARLWLSPPRAGHSLHRAVRFTLGEDSIFVYHGHQATIFFERFNWLSEVLLRFIANPLRIPNFPVMYESRKRYVTEHRVYDFSSSRRLVSVIGHTHRPLFESLSKLDALKFRIERLCREYPAASPRARSAIEAAVASCRAELDRLWEKDPADARRDSLYDSRLSVPCLFNSGCAIGKRGITAIEIADGSIALVHWFDAARGARRIESAAGHPEPLPGTSMHRAVIKQDHLSYIFTRIRLLAGPDAPRGLSYISHPSLTPG
jgi:predicted phosphodiesterase